MKIRTATTARTLLVGATFALTTALASGACTPSDGPVVEGVVDEGEIGDDFDPGTTEPVSGGTPNAPRQINLQANAALQFTDETGAQVTQIQAALGETIEFVIDNTAGFDHNFYIGPAEDLQVPFGETEAGIATWTSGVETYTWTVPESGTEGLQFACTVPGHYTPMHGDIVISS